MATLIRGDGRIVNAYQDSIMGDFAFSGKDGIIKNVGQACGLDTGTLNMAKVKSGMVVIQGRQITLDGTDSISLPVATGGTVYWTTLYLELDMGANVTVEEQEVPGKVTLKKLEYTSSYPAVPVSDNLKVQTAGKAYLGLYQFKNTANGITETKPLAEIIDSGDLSATTAAKFKDIEKRLDELGFKSGSIQTKNIKNVTLNELKRQGKYVIGRLDFETFIDIGNSTTFEIGSVSSDFIPKETTEFPVTGNINIGGQGSTHDIVGLKGMFAVTIYKYTVRIDTAGIVSLILNVRFNIYGDPEFNGISPSGTQSVVFGYEVP